MKNDEVTEFIKDNFILTTLTRFEYFLFLKIHVQQINSNLLKSRTQETKKLYYGSNQKSVDQFQILNSGL